MSNELEVPDYLKAMMESSSVPQTEDMPSIEGSSVPRISLKGKIFRFKEDGEEIEKVKENLDVIIVGVMPKRGNTRTFYEGDYNPDVSDPPDCSSMDGVRPDNWVSNPKSELCATCVNDKFGSAISMKGKKAKACRISRRIYVVRAKELKDEVPKVWMINVTIMSLKPFSAYSKELAASGIPTPSVVITRLNFNEDAEFPQLDFKAMGVINENNAKLVFKIADNAEWDTPQSHVSGAIGQDKQKLIESDDKPIDKPVDKSVDKPSSESVDSILGSW